MDRRDFIRLVGSAAALASAPKAACAEASYPSRPVRILAGFAAGGGVDITARLIGQWLNERLGQPFVTENRTGADGNIATEAVVNAPPDGYTLLLATLPNAVNATLYPNLKFVFLRDVAPVAGVIRVPMVALVHPSMPVKSIAELIAYAKANPGKINMASAGPAARRTWQANCSTPWPAPACCTFPIAARALLCPTCSADRCKSCSPPPPEPWTTSS